jgi:hypothetical protein
MDSGQAMVSHHEDEAEGVDGADKGVKDPGVPGAVRLVQQRVHTVGRHQREQRVAQVTHGLRVILLRLGLPARTRAQQISHFISGWGARQMPIDQIAWSTEWLGI